MASAGSRTAVVGEDLETLIEVLGQIL